MRGLWTTYDVHLKLIGKRVVDFLLVTRNSSGDEIANVNFLYDDIVHAL